jgi:4'-phosphopantetheinyl transferase
MSAFYVQKTGKRNILETMLWQQPAIRQVNLPRSEVHVWRLSLTSKPRSLGIDLDCLSEDERLRADAFRFQRDKDSFGLCRCFLRRLLGQYLGIAPQELRFGAGRYGKPFLEAPAECGGIEFSLSHSGDYGLFAFSRGRRTGVDIERIRNFEAMMDVSRRFFSPREHAGLRAMPEQSRAAAFYACWTRKEAVVKALGGSIAILCEEVVVSVLPEGPADLLRMPSSGGKTASWRLMDLPAGPGYAGALCFEEPPAVLGDHGSGPAAVKLWEPAGVL